MSASLLSNLSPSATKLFTSALAYTDLAYDPRAVHFLSPDTGEYDTRTTAMYATGLLLRNGNDGQDVERATRMIELVIAEQYGWDTNGTQWFGTYPHAPEEPAPGTAFYGVIPYENYDPNWRDFVGSVFSLALATSEHLLPQETVKKLENSLLLAAEGLSVRYQGRGEYANSIGVNTSADNYDQAYTNPWLMSTFLLGYIGDRLNVSDLKTKSDEDAQAIYDLFTYSNFNTFSEYNSGTYTGVDLYALALWVKYSPESSKMREYGRFVLEKTLEDIGTLYHAGLSNLAGPWDRTYGFDMTRYHAVLAYFIASLAPPSSPQPIPFSLPGSLHLDDYPSFAALNAFLSPIIAEVAPKWVLDNFATFEDGNERTLERRVRTNTEDPEAVRNVTAWLGTDISIGAQSLDEPSLRQSSMIPAIVQWKLPPNNLTNIPVPSLPPRIAYLALSPPTFSVINATASARKLELSFPPSQRWETATIPGMIVFAAGGFDQRLWGVDMSGGLEALPGLGCKVVGTNGLGEAEVKFNVTESFNGFYSWYITYPVNTTWPVVPSITLTFDV